MDVELGFAFRTLTFQGWGFLNYMLKFCCSCALFHMYDGESYERHDV